MRFIYPFTNRRREGVKNKQFIEILEICKNFLDFAEVITEYGLLCLAVLAKYFEVPIEYFLE